MTAICIITQYVCFTGLREYKVTNFNMKRNKFHESKTIRILTLRQVHNLEVCHIHVDVCLLFKLLKNQGTLRFEFVEIMTQVLQKSDFPSSLNFLFTEYSDGF